MGQKCTSAAYNGAHNFSQLFRRWCKARTVCPAQHDSFFLDHVLKKDIIRLDSDTYKLEAAIEKMK